ncbi:MAG: hypothetical protein IJ794_01300 [Lachnospiraceae bacterium]|nr:hypothetical protein [Lachnospiraceae bacterium]
MKVHINVKGVSRKTNKVMHLVYEYPDCSRTVAQFLEETVRKNLRVYLEEKAAPKLQQLFTMEQLEDMAQTGKVTYGDRFDDRVPDEEQAVQNALQCFADGMIALFIDEKRYGHLEDEVHLRENSEVTFIRLTFLAGRMW